ncbi:MAG: SDR family oxidoreductase [Dehalococcoidales bacterium]|nr:SDR family oxidoreductase [Dehalococcoidales bacterium]
MSGQVLKDRVAIVTGASRGLGEGITKAFAGEGATVALFSRDIQRLNKHVADLKALGQEAVAFPVDVADVEQVNRAVDKVVSLFGRVEILVNNAAVAPSMLFVEMSDEVRDSVIDVNIKGVWNCTRAVMPLMLKQRYGKVINISSVTGPLVSGRGMTAYAASKGAVSAFTRTLALEVAEYGINVNAICPGSFDTPMFRSVAGPRGWDSEDEYVKHVGKEIPLGRLGTIEEMGDLAVFLASDKSKYITGVEIVIDGGNIIQEHKR